MPKKREKERIVCDHFVWLLGQRGEVFMADGRSNSPPLGRHSLGTKDYKQALTALRQLDLVKAVEVGKADRALLDTSSTEMLGLEAGWELYRAHISRSRLVGGVKENTKKRYRAVFGKFIPFARGRGISAWIHVNRQVLEAYAAWLDDEGYAYATEYLELTTLKQAVKWFTENEHLPIECRITGLNMPKPAGGDTYCWTATEVAAIVACCKQQTELNWLGAVVVALASTGLRISELAALRWSDIDFERNMILLTDESTHAPRRRRRKARETKNSRSRSFPIHDGLRTVLLGISQQDGGLIFRGPRGGVLKPDTVRRILIRDVLSKLEGQFPTPEEEMGFADGRLHTFRHYFCSQCANSNVPERVVMAWLGHQSSRMVKRYYHLHDEEAQRQMKKLNFVKSPDTGEERSAG
jgi:integrase